MIEEVVTKKKGTKYEQGYRWENELVNRLKKLGFPLAIRTAGSHSSVDVLACSYTDTYFFQCKSTDDSVLTDSLVQKIFRNKKTKDLTDLPSCNIKILAFKARGEHTLFYRWNNEEWVYLTNKVNKIPEVINNQTDKETN